MPVAAKNVSQKVNDWARSSVLKARADYSKRDSLMHGLRRQRFMRLRPNPPESYQRLLGEGVRVPITYRLIQTIIGAVAGSDRIRFHVVTPDPELATRAEKWCALNMQAQERLGQPALYWRWWDSLVADGMSVLKTQRHPWVDFPQREENEEADAYNNRVKSFLNTRPSVPWRTRVLDPATFYPPRAEWGRGFVIESGLRPTDSALGAMGLTMNRNGKLSKRNYDEPLNRSMTGLYSTQPLIQVDEIWDNGNVLICVNNGDVFEFENELGELPYIWTFANATAFADPTLQGTGAAFPLIYLEPWVNQALSTLVGYMTMQATPTPFTTQEPVPGAVNPSPQVTDFKAGKFHQFGPGVKPGTWELPQATESVNLLNTMVQLAERFTLSPLPQFAGTRTPGVVMSAVAERMMSILRPMVDQAQVSWSDQMKMYFRLMRDQVKAPVYVSGLTFEEKNGKRGRAVDSALSPRDLNKIADVIAEVKFQTVQDKIAWNTHVTLLKSHGLWSEKRAMLETGVEDPEGEAQQILVEQLLKSAPAVSYILQKGMAGQPPLEALAELVQGVGAEQTTEEPQGGAPGRNAGEPRAPGGQREATAPAGRMRG